MSTTPCVRQAVSAADVERARALFVEYADWLNIDLCFQGFAQELATLPGAYAAPHGRLFIAADGDDTIGCIALRPLKDATGGCGGSEQAPDAMHVVTLGEVKRLYVRPAHRNAGWGRQLVQRVMRDACAIGYRELRLDTLQTMSAARKLYADHGFRECAPYYVNPHAGVVYMSALLPHRSPHAHDCSHGKPSLRHPDKVPR